MRRTLARMLLLLALPLCLLGPALLPGRAFAPLAPADLQPLASERASAAGPAFVNYLAVDALLPIASDREVLRARLGAGELPLWEHRQGLGLPLAGNSMAAPFHPLTWVTLPFGARLGPGLRALLALFLAGLGMWLLLERLGLSFGAAAIGALALQSGGWGLANLPLAPKFDAALALPWMLWAVEGWLGARRGSAWALLAAGAWSFLAGFPPIAVFALGATCLWILVRARALGVGAARGGGAIVLSLCAVGLAAPQLALNLDASRQSTRGRQPAAQLQAQALPGITALGLVAPRLFGSPLEPLDASRDPLTWRLVEREDASRAQQANALEWDLWIGLGTLALAAAGLAAATRRALFPAALGLFALAFAQGWPGVALLYVLPGLDLGAPARAACLLWPAAAWLAALGAEALLARAPRAGLACGLTLALGVCAAVVFALRFDPVAWVAELPAVLAARFEVDAATVAATVDLEAAGLAAVRLGRAATGVLSAGLLLAAGLALMLRIDSPRWRWVPLLLGLCIPGLLHGWASLVPRALERGAAWWPQSESMDALARAAGDGRVLRLDTSAGGVQDVLALARPNLPQVYDTGDLTPYVVFPARRTVELLAALDPDSRYRSGASRLSRLELVDHPILDLLRVTALLSRTPLQHARLEPLLEREGFCVYRRRGVPPVAWLVPAALESSDDAEVLERLAARDFDPAALCLLAPGASADAAEVAATDWTPGELSVRRPRAEQLELEVRGGSGGWLVVSEAWAPGWEAELDGRAVELLRADHALRAVHLPPGDHALRMVYRPRAWTLGWLVAGLALALGALLARTGAARG